MPTTSEPMPILHLDVVGYAVLSADFRTMVLQQFQKLLTAAAQFVMPYGDPWKKWARQGTGDGYYLFLDGLGPKVALMVALNLEQEVQFWNRRNPDLPLRFRMVFAYGRIEMVGNQCYGEALIESARLLDSSMLRIVEKMMWLSGRTGALAVTIPFHVALASDSSSSLPLPELAWSDLSFSGKHGKEYRGKVRSYPASEILDAENPIDKLAWSLLLNAAQFALGEPIVEEHLLATVKDQGDKTKTAALGRLVELNLIQQNEQGLLVHPMIQQLCQEADSIEAQNEAQTHVATVINLDLLTTIGLRLKDIAAWEESERFFRRALKVSETVYGPTDSQTTFCLNNLADLLARINRPEEAEPLYRRALAIDEALGPNHPDFARDLSNLALLLQATDRLAEAEPLFRRALAIRQSSLGPDHPDTQQTAKNLQTLLGRQDFHHMDISNSILITTLGYQLALLGYVAPSNLQKFQLEWIREAVVKVREGRSLPELTRWLQTQSESEPPVIWRAWMESTQEQTLNDIYLALQ